MKKLSLLVIALCITCGSVSAQQALFGGRVTDHLNVYTVRGISNVSNILTKNHYPFTYMETDGGHIWRNWRIYLGEFAQKIFK